jgi:hypothetical protein
LVTERRLVVVDDIVVEVLVALRTLVTRRLVATLYFTMARLSTSVSILLAPLKSLLRFVSPSLLGVVWKPACQSSGRWLVAFGVVGFETCPRATYNGFGSDK